MLFACVFSNCANSHCITIIVLFYYVLLFIMHICSYRIRTLLSRSSKIASMQMCILLYYWANK